jgi:hypothetical protein
MKSKLELLEQHISELEAEILSLRKLRQIIEENAMRDARVEELEQKNTEHEARLALLEQGVTEVNETIYSEVTVSAVGVSDSVVDQLDMKRD